MRDLTGAAAGVGHAAKTAADRIDAALNAAKHDKHARVTLCDIAISAETDVQRELAAVDIGAKGWLVPPLASGRKELVEKIAKAQSQLTDAVRLTHAMRTFLAGPSKYLVLGGNNAEMRALGIATTSGVALINDGSIDVTDFYDVDVVNVPLPGVPTSAELQHLYDFMLPQRGYENTVTTPNFPTAADIATRVSDINAVGPIDGVIYTDTVTLQALLGVIGPVTVDGITYDAKNAASELINSNYLRYQTSNEAPERRAAQSNVAKAIFDAMNTRDYSVTRLASVLWKLGLSRHLLAYAKDPTVNELWQKVGADGATHPDDFVITSQEMGASKLDYYVTLSCAMTVTKLPGGAHRLSYDITVNNPVKTGPTSPYILGGGFYADPGQYGSFLSINVPKSASDLVYPTPTAKIGPDGPLYVVSILFRVDPGKPATWHYEMTLPASVSTLHVLPSARLAPVQWTINGQRANDSFPFPIDFDQLPYPTPPASHWYLFAAMVAFGLALLYAGSATVDRNSEVSRVLAPVAANTAQWLAVAGTALLIAQLAANIFR